MGRSVPTAVAGVAVRIHGVRIRRIRRIRRPVPVALLASVGMCRCRVRGSVILHARVRRWRLLRARGDTAVTAARDLPAMQRHAGRGVSGGWQLRAGYLVTTRLADQSRYWLAGSVGRVADA